MDRFSYFKIFGSLAKIKIQSSALSPKFVVSFLLFLNFSIYAQEPTTINYTTDDGLSSNEVYGLLEDKNGFIWAGTNKGACRFDSHSFQHYTPGDGLADSDILSIHQDSKGNIWFLSYNGKLSYWNNGIIYNAANDSKLGHIDSKSFFHSFLEDQQKNLWFGTNRDGIFKVDFDDKVSKVSCPDFSSLDPTFSCDDSTKFGQQHLFESVNKVAHIITGKADFREDGKEFKLYYKFKERQSLAKHFYNCQNDLLFSGFDNNISAVLLNEKRPLWQTILDSVIRINNLTVLSDSLLYVAADIGLYVFDQKGVFKKKLLQGKSISDVLIDREGNLWVSTLTQGIFLIRNRKVLNYSTAPKYSILPLEDSILFGGNVYDLNAIASNQIYSIPISYKTNHLASKQDRIITLAKGPNHQIWLGTQKGLYALKKDIAYLKFFSKINDILPYKGDLFAASFLSCVKFDSVEINKDFYSSIKPTTRNINQVSKIIDSTLGVFKQPPSCFSNVINNQFYMGSKEGIFSYVNSKETFQAVLSIPNILKIQQNKEHDLWLLHKDSGLYFFNRLTEGLVQIELPYKTGKVLYTSLELDSYGNVWVGSNKGVFFIEQLDSTYEIKHYNQNNGLVTNEINALKVIDDDIWLATSKGITHLPEMSIDDSIPPLFFIDSIVIGSLSTSDLSSISLYDNNNTLSVHYTGISYKDLGNLNFEYQLAGESELKTATKERKLLLTDLPPSDYTLSIFAKDAFGNKSKTQKIHFTVILPWWKNWKYWLAIILLILCLSAIAARILFKKSFAEMYELLNGKFPFLDNTKFITLKSATSGGLEKIKLNELYYIEAAGDYMEVYTKNKKVLVRTTLKSLVDDLAEEADFLKVHKSYIVNLKKVDSFRKDCLEIHGKKIPVARNKRTFIKEYSASLKD